MAGQLLGYVLPHFKQEFVVNLEQRMDNGAQHLGHNQVVMNFRHRELDGALCPTLIGEVASLPERRALHVGDDGAGCSHVEDAPPHVP